MIRTIKFAKQDGSVCRVFLGDPMSGHSAKDIVTVPGVYDEIASTLGKTAQLKLELLVGAIGSYSTTCFALTVDGQCEEEDVTSFTMPVITLPDTAAKAIIATYSDTIADAVTDALDALHFYESIHEDHKLCLPEVAFSKLDPVLASKMISVRKSYNLRSIDNQEIFQKSFDSDYNIELPSVEAIHGSSDELISALDILRVIAPYRKMEYPGAYSYKSIYHTPYYKVDLQLRGFVPSYFAWIDGYSSNDKLEIESNERKIAQNLQTLIYSDISHYIAEMISGVFFDTPLGAAISRLYVRRDPEVVQQLLNDIQQHNSTDASCSLTFSQIEELQSSGWGEGNVTRVLRSSISFSPTYLKSMVESRPVDHRTVDCENIPFTLDIADDQERDITDMMIKMGYISSAMQRFLIDLCKKAYRVNWGHTGATLAIPGFVLQSKLSAVDKDAGAWVSERLSNPDVVADSRAYQTLYVASSDTSDIDNIGGEDNDNASELYVRMDYYMTGETIEKVRTGTLDYDYFTSKPSPGQQTKEAAVIEYWRTVRGDNNLDNFITVALLQTADPSILVECFVKLMRWGERKSKLLVLQKHPEIRHVFDLYSGLRIDNTSIVDESMLVQHNGCDYTLNGFLCSDSNPGVNKNHIIGFLLEKDYGIVKKNYLASWIDIGEMYANNSITIGDFMSMTPINLTPSEYISIEAFEKRDYEIYLSDTSIQEGLKLNVQPKDLSAIVLLTRPAIMNSKEYLISLRDTTVIGLRDRQYDILHRYTTAISKFYRLYAAKISAVKTTVDLAELAGEFLKVFQNGESEKQDANSATAANALQKLNLTGNADASSDVVKWDTSTLTGPFTIVTDTEMASTIPPIEFSDPALVELARKTGNRIVLLLQVKSDKIIFCRKDITASEVQRRVKTDETGRKKQIISRQRYNTFAADFAHLLTGGTKKLKDVPVVLHQSLQGFV